MVSKKERKTQLPTSSAGLVRYMEEERTKVWMKPHVVLALAIAIIVIMVLVHYYGPQPAT